MRAHHSLVRMIVRDHGVPERDIDCVAQAVFVILWRRLQASGPPQYPSRWLRTVAKNAAYDHTEKNQLWLPGPLDLDECQAPDQKPTAEDLLIARETAAEVQEVLATLEPGRREVLIRHEMNGEPVDEIAVALGLRLGTAYNRLRLARRDFTAELRRRRLQEERTSGRRLRGLWLPLAFLRWEAIFREAPGTASPAAPSAGPAEAAGGRRERAGGGSNSSSSSSKPRWLACAVVVLAVLFLIDSSLRPATGSGSDAVVAAVQLEPGAVVETNPAVAVAKPAVAVVEAKPAVAVAPPLAAPSQARASEQNPLPLAATEPKALAPAPAPSARPRVVVGPPATKRRSRNLEAARILLDTAERMAAEGRQDAVDGALRDYAVLAPDNPLPATRAAVGRTGEQKQPRGEGQ
jgi:RNA polymerase sigma-70 factor (ECF subfamily)